MRALSIAATGMLAQQTNVEVIANNLANMNTTAYKMQRAEFQDLLYQNIERPGSASADTGAVLPAGIQIGVGVRAAATYRITGQGNIATTGNQYDGTCQSASKALPLTTSVTTQMVRWSDLTGGKKVGGSNLSPDPTQITSIAWVLPWSGDGSAQYMVDITVDNIKFMTP